VREGRAVPYGGSESWLWAHRIKLALALAVLEGIVVALEDEFSRITVIVIAVPIILFYLLAGRTLESRAGREITWVLAASQSLAVIVVILAFILNWLALLLAGVFALVAIYLLVHDRPQQTQPTKRQAR
jgi:hypothetical protein